MSTDSYTAGEKRRRRPTASIAVALLLLGLSANWVNAQDWTSGLSPWSTLGTLTSPSTPSSWPQLTQPMGPSTLSPWSAFANPMTSPGLSSMPYGYGNALGSQWPGLSGLNMPYGQQPFGSWPTPGYPERTLSCPDARFGDSHQPDLTGMWRGSAGETVEIERNRARIWGGRDEPCSCVFFLIGQRLIAYSPDSDVVRKYWYQGSGNQFSLIDEGGNLMTFRRTR